jgi:hypothetical protein
MKHQLIPAFLKAAALVMLSLQLTGCIADSSMGTPPACSITSVEKHDRVFAKSAEIVIKVENTGEGATAYYVTCIIKLTTGNTIIETGTAHFGTLESGEAAIGVATFSRIEKHSEYSHAEYKLYWYDAENRYYEK